MPPRERPIPPPFPFPPRPPGPPTGSTGLIGVPAAYTLARRNFPGKRLLMLLFLLPLMVPPITYGIPLATVLYKAQLAGTIYGVIIANLIPAAPFVILVMTPFIEQIDPNLESAARVFGARTGSVRDAHGRGIRCPGSRDRPADSGRFSAHQNIFCQRKRSSFSLTGWKR